MSLCGINSMEFYPSDLVDVVAFFYFLFFMAIISMNHSLLLSVSTNVCVCVRGHYILVEVKVQLTGVYFFSLCGNQE